MRHKISIALSIAFLAIMLIGCAKPQLIDGPSNTLPNNEVVTRPEIPRVNPPQDTPDNPIYENPGEQQHGKPPILINNKTPSVDLDLPMNELLGKHHPIIRVGEFPLLKHQPIRVSSSQLVGYSEEIRFNLPNSTGKIVMSKDEEEIGTFLLFEHDKPIFEYSITLDRGTFKDLQGREIRVLGHNYIIAEVTNYSVALFGKDVSSTLFFENGSRFEMNMSRVKNSVCKVTRNKISYTLYADGNDKNDNILLSPQESLSDNLGHAALGSYIFDISYKGSPLQNSSSILLRQSKYGYKLEMSTFKGRVIVPIVEQDAGRLILGDLNTPLRITPCPAQQTYCVAKKTLVPMTSGKQTFFLEYTGIDTDAKHIIFRDLNDNKYVFEYTGTPGKDAYARISLDGSVFTARIGPTSNLTKDVNISVAQGYNQGIVEFVDAAQNKVRIEQVDYNNSRLRLRIIGSKNYGSYNSANTENIDINLTYSSGWSSRVTSNLTFYEDDDNYDTYASTAQGTLVWITRDKNEISKDTGKHIELLIPTAKRYGIVVLEG